MLISPKTQPGRLTLLGRLTVTTVALALLGGASCEGENAMAARLIIEVGGGEVIDTEVICPFTEQSRDYDTPSCNTFEFSCDPSCGPTGARALIDSSTCPELERITSLDWVDFGVLPGHVYSTAYFDNDGQTIPVFGEVTGDDVQASGKHGARFDASVERIVYRSGPWVLDLRDVELHGLTERN